MIDPDYLGTLLEVLVLTCSQQDCSLKCIALNAVIPALVSEGYDARSVSAADTYADQHPLSPAVQCSRPYRIAVLKLTITVAVDHHEHVYSTCYEA